MNFQPLHRALLGVASFLPITSLAAFAAYAFAFRGAEEWPLLPAAALGVAASALLGMIGVAFHFVHLFGSNEVPKERRLLWSALLIVFHVFASPFYYLAHVRRGADRRISAFSAA